MGVDLFAKNDNNIWFPNNMSGIQAFRIMLQTIESKPDQYVKYMYWDSEISPSICIEMVNKMKKVSKEKLRKTFDCDDMLHLYTEPEVFWDHWKDGIEFFEKASTLGGVTVS